MNAPPIGICDNCRDYTRDAQQINQQCPACKTGLYVPRRRGRDWVLCAGCAGAGVAEPGKMDKCYLCRGSGWTATHPFGNR